jgi:hypothetical protein
MGREIIRFLLPACGRSRLWFGFPYQALIAYTPNWTLEELRLR